jgi:hypothetical protein
MAQSAAPRRSLWCEAMRGWEGVGEGLTLDRRVPFIAEQLNVLLI